MTSYTGQMTCVECGREISSSTYLNDRGPICSDCIERIEEGNKQ